MNGSDWLSVKDFGAKGDGQTDDSDAIQQAIKTATGSGQTLYFPSGVYCYREVNVVAGRSTISLKSGGNVTFFNTSNNGRTETFVLSGERVAKSMMLRENLVKGTTTLNNPFPNAQVGDLIQLRSNRLLDTDSRGKWVIGQVFRIQLIKDGKLYFGNSVVEDFSYSAPITITATSTGTSSVQFSGLDTNDGTYVITGLTGANAGVSRGIFTWDNSTKTATFDTVWDQVWPKPVAKGDTFEFQRSIEAVHIKPAKVEVHGPFKFMADLSVNNPERLNLRTGLHINYAIDSAVVDIETEGFSYAGLSFGVTYNTLATRMNLKNTNDSSTGYGFTAGASSYSNFSNAVISGCRSGFTTGSGACLAVGNLYSDMVIHRGIPYFNTGAEMTGYGFGGHGNAHSNVYSNITCHNLATGSSMRDYNAFVHNCKFFGLGTYAFFLHRTKGVTIENCSLHHQEDVPEKGFISFRADNVNMDGTVFVDGCKATGLTRPFFSLSGYNASKPLRNIKFRNNYAKFNNTGSRQVGVSGISTNVVLDNSVEFLGGNLVDYSFDATHYGSTGFVTPNTDWKVINNKAYRIDINKWYLSIEPGALATIDIKNRLRSVVKFSVSGAQADNAQGIIRFTARDYSPLEAISMAGWYIAGSESEATVPNRLNMWRSEENPSIIHIKNNKDTTRAFSITLEAIL